MIGSLGGTIIDKQGNRVTPGAGGAVGGLSAPGRNYGYLVGAGGDAYYRFTPTQNMSIQPPNDPGNCPNPPCIPPIIVDPPPPGGPTIDPPPPPPPPPTGGGVDCTTGNCNGRDDEATTQATIFSIFSSLLKGNGIPQRTNQGPIYLFTPGQASSGGGVNMKMILLVAIVAAAGWFAYKKFA